MDLSIDKIFEMLSWDNDEKTQAIGVSEAGKVKSLSVFIQPIESKSVWENCAKVLASKSDEELERYLVDLFKWLQDMNWPGAEIVYDRLKRTKSQSIDTAYNICLQLAEENKDTVWKNVLVDFYKDFKTIQN